MKNYFFKLFLLFLFISSEICSQSNKSNKKLVILHTNDTHSRIEQIDKKDKKFPSQGGYYNRSAIIERIKKENDNVLVFDAGDFFQGTPYFNFFEGILEIELMNKIGYNASTLGNHEFDNGVEELYDKLIKANFDIILTNYNVSATLLKSIIKPWKIYKINNLKVGVIGLGVNPEGLISPNNFKDIKYIEPYSIAEETAKMLKKQKKCNIVICLSHLGYQQPKGIANDIELANTTSYIDIIIGGHTHTFLENPTEVINNQNHKVLITQCGSMGVNLGRIDIEFLR